MTLAVQGNPCPPGEHEAGLPAERWPNILAVPSPCFSILKVIEV